MRNFILEHEKPHQLISLRNRFAKFGFLLVTDFLHAVAKKKIKEQVLNLLAEHSERRDLALKTTGNTPRKMSVVRSEVIADKGDAVVGISKSPELLSFLGDIAMEKIYPGVSPDEEYLITKQEQKGDTHGWHWGDYSFALIWVVETPPIEYGGMLQCVPHTFWDKESPQIHQWLVDNPIFTYGLAPGDVYFLRTDTTLHRTVPLNADKVRIILNMTYSSARELNIDVASHNTDRWWEDENAEQAKSL